MPEPPATPTLQQRCAAVAAEQRGFQDLCGATQNWIMWAAHDSIASSFELFSGRAQYWEWINTDKHAESWMRDYLRRWGGGPSDPVRSVVRWTELRLIASTLRAHGLEAEMPERPRWMPREAADA